MKRSLCHLLLPAFLPNLVGLIVLSYNTQAQIPDGTLFRRVSRASNFEFAIHNSGMLFGDWSHESLPLSGLFAKPFLHWPRGSFHLRSDGIFQGLLVLAKKDGRLLASDAGFMREAHSSHGPFNQMVPGWVGDPKAGVDSTFNKEGWPYVDDGNYIVYSSLDYDSSGVDISGSNFFDWPVRLVAGKRTYIPDPLERHRYPPVYVSDEDMFCVFKDTDSRAGPIYAGPDGPSTPIGVEVQNSIFSWGDGPGRDIIVVQNEIINKSGVQLDSCHVVFASGIRYLGSLGGNYRDFSVGLKEYSDEHRMLVIVQPGNPASWSEWWLATPVPPTIGHSFLQDKSSRSFEVEFLHGWNADTAFWYLDSTSYSHLSQAPSDSIVYRVLTSPPPVSTGRFLLWEWYISPGFKIF